MSQLETITLPKPLVTASDIIGNPYRLAILLNIIRLATLTEQFIDWVKGPRRLVRGQAHTSVLNLAVDLDMNRETITRHLAYLEFRKFLALDRSTRFGIVATVLNFESYTTPVYRIDAHTPTNEPANGPPNEPANEQANGPANAVTSACRRPPLEIPLSNVEEKNIIIAREGQAKPTLKQIEECWNVYCASLKALGIPPKNASPHHQSTLARAIAYSGFEDVRDALEGVRYETKSGDFDPKKHVSLDYCLHRNSKTGKWNLERLGNIARMKRQAQDDRNGAYS